MSHTFDLFAPDFPHGTPDGYRRGCHGSMCGSVMTCRDVYTRYQGDWGFKRLIDQGMTAADILAMEAATQAQRAAEDRAAAKAAHLQDSRAARGALGARAQVAKLHAEGLNDAQITERLGLNRNYVAKLRRELGLEAVRPPKVEKPPRVPRPRKQRQGRQAEIIRLHGEGFTNAQIGGQVGCTTTWVSKVISNAGRKANEGARVLRLGTTMRRGDQARETVAAWHAEGLTDRQIADRSGLKYPHVALVRRKLGLQPNAAPAECAEPAHNITAPSTPAIMVEDHAPVELVHGTVEMYDAGCRKGSECPARPNTCTMARLEQDRARRREAQASA